MAAFFGETEHATAQTYLAIKEGEIGKKTNYFCLETKEQKKTKKMLKN